jgi:hypothetical protein
MAKQITTEEIIAKYPKIFEDYQGNPGRVNWHGVPSGWLPIIDKLCGCIQWYIDHHVSYTKDGQYKPNQVTCTQMKEKFGGLRFYTNGHDEVIEGMIKMAEHLCDSTCQDCGSEEDLGVTSGWITVLCRNCVIAHGDRAMGVWKPKNI